MASRWFLLAILTGSYGAGAFGVLGISPLSPSLVAGFGLTRLQVALIIPSIVVGLLVGPATFGLLLVSWDSYAAPWTAFAALSAIAAAATLVISPAIARERR